SGEAELLQRQKIYLARLDERDIEKARDYSRRNPSNYFTRREQYQQYLDRHPAGTYAGEARQALAAIASESHRNDYRLIRQRYLRRPDDLEELRKRCRTYLSSHAQGRYRSNVDELLRWCGKCIEGADYTVTLKSGSFSKKVAALVSRGPSLSVE